MLDLPCRSSVLGSVTTAYVGATKAHVVNNNEEFLENAEQKLLCACFSPLPGCAEQEFFGAQKNKRTSEGEVAVL